MPGFFDRARSAWDVFRNKESEPDIMLIPSFEATYQAAWRDSHNAVLAPIKTRVAIDAASIPVQHVMVDENGQYKDTRKGFLNDRLTILANRDQTATAFRQDAFAKMLDFGAVAIVPTRTTANPRLTQSYEPLELRTAQIVQWFTDYVRVYIYNDVTGQKEERTLHKNFVAIAYNPFYSVMNLPNSTLRRLVDKLALLDVADSKINSPNLDAILHLPYALRSERKKAEADRRLAAITEQLNESRYGMAYVDATEKVTQLNRPVTNSLAEQVQYLEAKLHNQLGLTEAIFNGSASQEEMLSYQNRTVEPVITAFIEALRVSFLTTTALSQGQSIMAFPSLFKMAPIETLAEASDKFTRNEIMTSNEVRAAIGLKPSADPGADELRNKNLNEQMPPEESNSKTKDTEEV